MILLNPIRYINWQSVKQWTEWMGEINVLRGISNWFCLSQLSQWQTNIHAESVPMPSLSKPGRVSSPDARLVSVKTGSVSNPKFAFLSVFVHYSHNNKWFFSGIRFKLTIDRKIKTPATFTSPWNTSRWDKDRNEWFTLFKKQKTKTRNRAGWSTVN